jgi:hypothetical protein
MNRHFMLPDFRSKAGARHLLNLHKRGLRGIKLRFGHKRFVVEHKLVPVEFFPHFIPAVRHGAVLPRHFVHGRHWVPIFEWVPDESSSSEDSGLSDSATEPSTASEITLLVLKNGAVYSAIEYRLVSGHIFFLTPDGVEASIPFDNLDLDTTQLSTTRARTLTTPEPGPKHIFVPVAFPSK